MKIYSRLKLTADDEWWNSLDNEAKKAYIQEHPNSKYAKKKAGNNKKSLLTEKPKMNSYELLILVDRDWGFSGNWETKTFNAKSNFDAILWIEENFNLEYSSYHSLEEEMEDFKSGKQDPRKILQTEDPSDYFDNVARLTNKTTNKVVFEDPYMLLLFEESKGIEDDEDIEDIEDDEDL